MNTPTLIDGQAALVTEGRESDWKALRDQLDRTAHAMGSGVLHVVVSGLMMEDLKATCKHGEFGPALHRNCYPDLSWDEFQKSTWRNCNIWMNSAKAACGILQIRNDFQFGRKRLAEVLTTDVLDLPKEAREIQVKFADLCAGSSQKQLQLAWKGEPAKKEYHPPKLTAKQRTAAQIKTATMAVEKMISDIKIFALQGNTLAIIPDTLRAELLEAGIAMNNRLREVTKEQKTSQLPVKGKSPVKP